jgi:hypothetical protein
LRRQEIFMSDLLLIDEGQAVAGLELSETAGPVEQHGAEELQRHLKAVAGTQLPGTGQSSTGIRVFVGRSPEVERLMGAFDWNSLKEDGCVVRTVDNQLILAGATPRGTLYAVYEFLETALGCRWLTPRCSAIPRQPTVRVSDLNIVYTPKFRYRDPWLWSAFNADWAAHNRVNGFSYPLDERHGGRWAYAGFVHTFYDLLPPVKHCLRHPEYFAEVGGRRTGEMAQLCLTNPAVMELVVEGARKLLRQHPGARVISVSQNDCYGNCTCAGCRAVDEEEGSPSGSLLRFVNGVAEQLEEEFPDVLVDTLAYMYTIDPPRQVRPRRNVVIRLCHLNSPCDSHPLDQCEMNRTYLEQLRKWGEIAPELFVWDYFNNFANYFMPYPNLDAICADIPLYAQAGVTGVFCQIDASPPKGPGDMAELRAYLLARLLWRPECDGRQVIDEFLRLYYGAAAEPIRDYLELLHGTVRGQPVHATPYLTRNANVGFLAPEIMEKAARLFDAAEDRVAEDEELTRRVAAARLPVNFMRFDRKRASYVVRNNRYESPDPEVAREGRHFFISAIRQGAEGLDEQSKRLIRDELRDLNGADLAMLERNGLKLFVAPSIGARIISLIDPVSGSDWMYRAVPSEPSFPVAGGYEEYTQANWRSPGWQESFVCEKGENVLWLNALLGNWLVLERTCSLEIKNGKPCLVIESVMRNAGVEPVARVLRLHPEFDAGDLDKAYLGLRRRDGLMEEWAPWRTDPAGAGSQWLVGDQLPVGCWSLVRGDRQLTVEFSKDVTKCLLSWERAKRLVRLDMFGKSVHLGPQDSVVLRQVWTPEPA